MLQLCRVGKGTHSFHVCIHESGLQVLLPEVYEGTFYYRKSATSIPDDDVQVKSDGQEATGAFDMLPSPGECASKFDGSPPTELPGWFFFREERRADHGGAWLVRFCSLPKPTPDDQAYIGRTVDSVSLLEITHSSELDLKSPMQILLTAGGGCSYTVRAGGNPYPLVTIPAADLHALTVLPPIGGGSWQLRALVRLQAWEILHSMFCGMASERTKCLVSDTLDQELINAGGRTSKELATEKAAAAAAAEAETPYEPPPDRKQPTPAALAWMQQRGLVHLLLHTEAPQSVISSVVQIAEGAKPTMPGVDLAVNRTLATYLSELRSPFLCGSWAIALVKDGAAEQHWRKNNLVLSHDGSGLTVGLHPESAGHFLIQRVGVLPPHVKYLTCIHPPPPPRHTH